MFGLGPIEIAVIVGGLLLLFGPSQLPRLGRSMAETVREIRGIGRAVEEEVEK
jgi:TatA/E family protein of Tat protein translocase